MMPTNLITYDTFLPEGTIHTPGMSEGWITETYSDGMKVTWCPLNFEAENGKLTAKIQMLNFGNGN